MKKERRKVRALNVSARGILFVVLLAFIVVFLFANSNILTDGIRIKILNIEIVNATGVWFLICYLLGIITWMLASVKALFNRRNIIKTKDKEIKELMNELAQYRNQALEDDAEEEVSEEGDESSNSTES